VPSRSTELGAGGTLRLREMPLRRGGRLRQEHLLAYLFLMPAALVVAGLIFYPLISVGNISLRLGRTMNFARLGTLPLGLGNYSHVIADPAFWHSVVVSAAYVGSTIGMAFVIGVGTALLLNRRVPGRRFLRTLLLIPWAVPGVAASIIFLWILDGSFGVVNAGLRAVGIDGPAWFVEQNTALAAVILPTVWTAYPLITLIVLAAMQSIPGELYEAATLDGASPPQAFRHVTWPGIRGAATLAVMISALAVFRSVDIIYAATRGGPNRITETVALFVYNEGFQYFRMGSAAAAGVLMVLAALLLSLIAIRVIRRESL
jgi:multiple sugar transport system permease protein